MTRTFLISFLITLYCSVGASQQRIITDADLAVASYTWSADTTYLLDGFVFLENGGLLNISPGTVIKGISNPSTGDNASALIIARGAQIRAVGTADEPIIFTAESDDVNDPDDLFLDGGELGDRGSWGGLIILGYGIVGVDGGQFAIEGIPAGDDRALYGGTNNSDNSGALSYVSIRYGGAALSPGDEINGLTLGGVGSGTIIDHIEVYGNADDGTEVFGGAVDLRYVIGAFCGDEIFDTDQSWAGRAQFVFGVQLNQDELNNEQYGGEHDGSEASDLGPQTIHKIYNATYIGAGPSNADGNGEANVALRIRNDVGIEYSNSIFTQFANKGARFQDSALEKYLADEFQLNNNIWWQFGDGEDLTDIIRSDNMQAEVIAKLLVENNELTNPVLAGISREADGGLDPRPNPGSPALSGAILPTDDWFESTEYRGAFGTDNWAMGWSALDQNGHLGNLTTVPVIAIDGLQSKVTTYPNPMRDLLYIDLDLARPIVESLTLTDVRGVLIKRVRLQGESFERITLDVHDLSKGFYFLNIVTSHAIHTIKLLK